MSNLSDTPVASQVSNFSDTPDEEIQHELRKFEFERKEAKLNILTESLENVNISFKLIIVQVTWSMPSTNARLSTTGEHLIDSPAQCDIMFTTGDFLYEKVIKISLLC